MVPPEQMASYVSAQVYALRFFSATSGQSFDHWGFAWAPTNMWGYSADDFAAKTGLVLDRLGAAVRDSAKTVDPEDPGSGACGPPGQSWCVGDIEDGHLNDAWKAFKVWTPAITFATPAPGVSVGAPSAAMNLELVSSTGEPFLAGSPLAVTLSSSSPRGMFSTTPSGPWSSTLSLTIAQGSSMSEPFYYLDTQVGTLELIASADGLVTATQELTVAPGPTVSLDVTPSAADVRAGGTLELAATGRDAQGNVFPVSVAWSLTPERLGSLTATTGTTTTLTANRTLGHGKVTATFLSEGSTLSAVATVNVVAGTLSISSIEYRRAGRDVASVTVTAHDAGGAPVPHAAVFIGVMRDGRLHYAARAVTDTAGHAVFRVPIRAGGCFTTTIRKVSAAGFTWDGRTPSNEYCRPQAP